MRKISCKSKKEDLERGNKSAAHHSFASQRTADTELQAPTVGGHSK
jgi:hypothetical protein